MCFRLGICFEKLPSLQTAKIVYQLSITRVEWHASSLGEQFERVKEFCACKPQLLSLEVRDYDGVEVNHRKVASMPSREPSVSERSSD